MPLFRVHVSHADLSAEKFLKTTDFAAGANELVVKDLKARGVTGYKITKTKVVRDESLCCACH